MNRRSLLAALPAAALAPAAALSGEVLPPGDTPVMTLFREWERLYAYLNSPQRRDMSDEDFNAELDRRIDIEDQMMRMPSQGPADFIAKVFAYTTRGEVGLPDHNDNPGFWAEARALLGGEV